VIFNMGKYSGKQVGAAIVIVIFLMAITSGVWVPAVNNLMNGGKSQSTIPSNPNLGWSSSLTGYTFLNPYGGSTAVLYKSAIQLWGNSYPAYGTINFYDPTGAWGGAGSITSSSVGAFTTGIIMTGCNEWEVFNGSSVYYPASYQINVPSVTMAMTGNQPNNYYTSIGVVTAYTIATSYSDTLIASSGGSITTSRTNSGTQSTANDTSIVHGTPVTYQYTISVSSTWAERMPSYTLPNVVPNVGSSNAVSGYMVYITNSTNAILMGAGTALKTAAGALIVVEPIPVITSTVNAASQTVTFTINYPTAQHVSIYAGTVWNTNLSALQAIAPGLTSWGAISYASPNSAYFTVGSFQLLGNPNAQHVNCLNTVS